MEGQIIPKLIAFFERFPGIGPRQARRFVYFLAEEKQGDIENFALLLTRFKNEVSHCRNCFRVFSAEGRSLPVRPASTERGEQAGAFGGEGKRDLCPICAGTRDKSKILVVEKDTDLENIERAGIYGGAYYVLGGLLSPLKPELQERLRFQELYNRIEREGAFAELILALATTTEGDMTTRYIERILEPLTKAGKIKISRLGRGLSTGTELEYSDRDTLKNAFENRK